MQIHWLLTELRTIMLYAYICLHKSTKWPSAQTQCRLSTWCTLFTSLVHPACLLHNCFSHNLCYENNQLQAQWLYTSTDHLHTSLLTIKDNDPGGGRYLQNRHVVWISHCSAQWTMSRCILRDVARSHSPWSCNWPS